MQVKCAQRNNHQQDDADMTQATLTNIKKQNKLDSWIGCYRGEGNDGELKFFLQVI